MIFFHILLLFVSHSAILVWLNFFCVAMLLCVFSLLFQTKYRTKCILYIHYMSSIFCFCHCCNCILLRVCLCVCVFLFIEIGKFVAVSPKMRDIKYAECKLQNENNTTKTDTFNSNLHCTTGHSFSFCMLYYACICDNVIT